MGLVSNFNRDLSLWFNAHGISNLEFVEGEDFCYYPEQRVIQWGFFGSKETDNHFMQFLYEYGFCQPFIVNTFSMSLLHEIGHYMTLHNFSNETRENDKVAKDNCVSDRSIETNYWYWELPTEFAANMWAIDWANEHPTWVAELQKFCRERVIEMIDDENIMAQLTDYVYDIQHGEGPFLLYIVEDDE